MSRRAQIALTALVAAALASQASPGPAAAERSSDRAPRLNDLQVVATHNSYHRELSGPERAAQLEVDPGADPNLYYSHASLTDQLAEQQVRSVELDVLPDPDGGLYAHPLVRRNAGLPPLADPAWQQPGTKVFHMVDVDYATTCPTLVGCLQELADWSAANPRHVPLVIMLELKASEDRFEQLGGVQSPAWDETAFATLEDEISSVFGPDQLITPDDVRRPGLTLEESVLEHGWPTVASSRGKVLFAMDNTNAVRDAYLEGHPSLEGRLLFTDSAPGTPSAAFIKRNEPRGNVEEITALVRQGYLVRTRSDVPMGTVLDGDTQMREDALRSGAQIVSTDFPAAGMSARYDRDFFVSLPGDLVARCTPVLDLPTCRDDRLE